MNRRNVDMDNIIKKVVSWPTFLKILLTKKPFKSKLLEMKYKAMDNNIWRETSTEQIK